MKMKNLIQATVAALSLLSACTTPAKAWNPLTQLFGDQTPFLQGAIVDENEKPIASYRLSGWVYFQDKSTPRQLHLSGPYPEAVRLGVGDKILWTFAVDSQDANIARGSGRATIENSDMNAGYGNVLCPMNRDSVSGYYWKSDLDRDLAGSIISEVGGEIWPVFNGKVGGGGKVRRYIIFQGRHIAMDAKAMMRVSLCAFRVDASRACMTKEEYDQWEYSTLIKANAIRTQVHVDMSGNQPVEQPSPGNNSSVIASQLAGPVTAAAPYSVVYAQDKKSITITAYKAGVKLLRPNDAYTYNGKAAQEPILLRTGVSKTIKFPSAKACQNFFFQMEAEGQQATFGRFGPE